MAESIGAAAAVAPTSTMSRGTRRWSLTIIFDVRCRQCAGGRGGDTTALFAVIVGSVAVAGRASAELMSACSHPVLRSNDPPLSLPFFYRRVASSVG